MSAGTEVTAPDGSACTTVPGGLSDASSDSSHTPPGRDGPGCDGPVRPVGAARHLFYRRRYPLRIVAALLALGRGPAVAFLRIDRAGARATGLGFA